MSDTDKKPGEGLADFSKLTASINAMTAGIRRTGEALRKETAMLDRAQVDHDGVKVPLLAMVQPELPYSLVRKVALQMAKVDKIQAPLAMGPESQRGKFGPLKDALVAMGKSIAAEHDIHDEVGVVVDRALDEIRRGPVVPGTQPAKGLPGHTQGVMIEEIPTEFGFGDKAETLRAVKVLVTQGAIGPEGEWVETKAAEQVALFRACTLLAEGVAAYRAARR